MPTRRRRPGLVRVLPWGLLALALLLPVGLALREAGGGATVEPLPDYGLVPEFELTERSGRAIRSAELAGRPWFANFIFTRCQGTCPVLSTRMAELRERIGDDVRLVSFSVDPLHDTPGVLSDYARRLHAPERQWLFVTGGVAELRALVTDGFHLSAAESASGGEITHSDRVALVDGDFRIRRYYLGTEKSWIDEAVRDLARLQ
ncbi:MAG: SCO family protein [Candidatus Binatia bacterium]